MNIDETSNWLFDAWTKNDSIRTVHRVDQISVYVCEREVEREGGGCERER